MTPIDGILDSLRAKEINSVSSACQDVDRQTLTMRLGHGASSLKLRVLWNYIWV